MKKTVRIISAVLLLVIAMSFIACGKKEVEEAPVEKATKADLYGVWKGIDGEISTLTFANNGSYRDDAGDGLCISGTYTVDEAAQTFTVQEEEYGMVFTYDFQISDNILSIQLSGGKLRKFARI